MSATVLNEAHFEQFAALIEGELGIRTPPNKRSMLQARLQRRLRELGMADFESYRQRLQDRSSGERVNFLDLATTNKTDFFRESDHFDILAQRILPELDQRLPADEPLLLWSAGCSRGHEPYTIAMVAESVLAPLGRRFVVLGTDISSRVLECARQAVYTDEELAPVPPAYRRFLAPGQGQWSGHCRIVPELRAKVRFHPLNFMREHYPLSSPVHIIFFRNVMIYFEPELQGKVLRRLCQQLYPGGYFFPGHSESLNGFGLPLRSIAPSAYQKPA